MRITGERIWEPPKDPSAAVAVLRREQNRYSFADREWHYLVD